MGGIETRKSFTQIAVFVAVLLIQGLSALPAFAKPQCWCKLRTSCSGTVIKNYGALEEYKWHTTQKKKKCSNACSLAASADQGSASLAAQVCDQLGPGSHLLQAFSVVGNKDNKNNTCDVDQTLGPVQCSRSCSCPKGNCSCPEGFQLKGDQCLGTCAPPGAGPLTIIDGMVAFPASCQNVYGLEGERCVGPCVRCSNGLCGTPDGLTGVSVSGGTVTFPATCTTQATWN